MKGFRPADYEEKLDLLADLQTLEREGFIDLFYGDESGFSLLPVVPYGWQAANQALERPSRYSTRLNVLAWLNEAGQLVSFTRQQSIDSAFVIECISTWARGLTKETVLVLDNAPMHRSKAFTACLAHWQEQGLYVFFLPAYSPHLNKAECLWRKMKYQWLEVAAYSSYRALRQAVNDILTQFGQRYSIRFVQTHCQINFV